MAKALWFNQKGEPIEIQEADKLLRDSAQRVVQKTRVKDGIGEEWLVSTVFLVLDHNPLEEGPPLLYETMVFQTDPKRGINPIDEYQERYSTREEAEAGHKRVCVMVEEWPGGKD